MIRRSHLALLELSLLAVLAPVLFCGFSGCSGGNTPQSPEPVVPVETARARTQSIANVVRAEGLLYPLQQASISPKITAPVEKFYAQRGDRVHAGQLLAVLENHDLAAAVVSAQGSYDQAKANYAATTSATLPEEIQTANLNLKNARTSLDAEQQLYDSERKLYRQGAIARKQLDAAQVAVTAARSVFETAQKHLRTLQSSGVSQQRQAAKGQLAMANGQYQAATAQLAYTQIRSPIDGVIADRAVYPGDIAPAGTPLLIVMDTSRVIARLHIPESQAVQIKLGDAASMQVPGFKKSFPAKVTVLSPALDPNSTTVEVWVEAGNPNDELKPGGSVNVSIVTQTIANALVIPDHAILTAANGETSVMIVGTDDRAYARTVKTGVQQGPLIQIASGLHAGEQVIVNGAYGLPDKTRVQSTPANPAESSQVLGP